MEKQARNHARDYDLSTSHLTSSQSIASKGVARPLDPWLVLSEDSGWLKSDSTRVGSTNEGH